MMNGHETVRTWKAETFFDGWILIMATLFDHLYNRMF